MSTRNIVKNIRSSAVVDGKPKLPQPTDLDFGEIAINYAENHETLSFKNNSNKIVSLSVKTVDDVTVNGNSVVSNKTANITMKGDTTPVADTYTTTTYPSPFESKAEHISATDKVDDALKKVETNISKLVSEVVDNENVVSEAISKLANSAGTIDGSNNITYIRAINAHYINNATSVHDATVKLDSNVYSIESSVSNLGTQVTNLDSYCRNLNNTVINLESQINSLQSQINSLQSTVNSLQMEFVDLGLPSRLQWAKCNIGAATETDYGDYFMWGSTTPDNNHTCNWANTPFNDGASDYDEAYFNPVKNTLCPDGVLAKEFDAAYKATNGIARMPTEAEFQELLKHTTNEWTQVNGVYGRKFTSTTDTSKHIFIPASGFRSDSSSIIGDNNLSLWSSSLDTLSPSLANCLNSSDSGVSTVTLERYYAFAVRAVRK